MKSGRIEIPYGAQNLTIETGKLAKQANGAVTVTYGGTVVLITSCVSRQPRAGIDFFPLMVEYQEKTYSAGRIPGGFFKREGRPTEKEILTSRVIDRPLRPLFPEGFFNDVQVVAQVLSSDGENDPDILALVGASAALMVSDIPFAGPVGAVRIAQVDGELVITPTYEQREKATLDFIVAGNAEGINMIEGEAKEADEATVQKALEAAHKAILPICEVQQQLQKEHGKKRAEVTPALTNKKLQKYVSELTQGKLNAAYQIGDKDEREEALAGILDEITGDMSQYDKFKENEEDEITPGQIKQFFGEIEYDEVRRLIFEEKRRADGRGLKDIREIICEVNVLPRTHGSSLFTRGQTQSMAIITLGTRKDEQLIESLEETTYKKFMLHYNFPSFSVGETRPMRGPGRREIGHGALAGKAIKPILPTSDDFPYTIRVVSEILESNGSSSMASVCSATLALMDAGVPISDPVAGISIGLISKDKEYRLITDIMGLEDHFGDMDFKVAGTRKGITAIQLDLKISQVPVKLLVEGMDQAKDARMVILDKMHEAIAKPRPDISAYAPRILSLKVPVEKIGEIIGPGGKTIKKIIEETGVVSIDIEDDGKVVVASTQKDAGEKAVAIISGMIQDPEIGRIYPAVVKRIMNFGAFCEFLPGKEGLVHVSELSNTFVKEIDKAVKVGDRFNVKVIEIDKMNRINLSKKQAEQG